MNKIQITNEFKRILKDLRTAKGLSQDEFAKELGISKGAVSYYETGQRVPDIVVLSAFADFFGVSTDYLLGRPGGLETNDEDIQAACRVTGLEVKTIQSFKKVKGIFLINNHCLSHVLDTIITSLPFKGLVAECYNLKEESSEVKNQFTTTSLLYASKTLGINGAVLCDYIEKTFGENFIRENDDHDNKGNIARYKSTKFLEDILGIFDSRSKINYANIDKYEWLSLLKIDEKTLLELRKENEEYESTFMKAGD